MDGAGREQLKRPSAHRASVPNPQRSGPESHTQCRYREDANTQRARSSRQSSRQPGRFTPARLVRCHGLVVVESSLRVVRASGRLAPLVADDVVVQHGASVHDGVHARLHVVVLAPMASPGQRRTLVAVGRVGANCLLAEDLDGAVELRAAVGNVV
eukprot:UN1241